MNYSQAKEEADRLSRMLKRDIEPAPVNCQCDYFEGCYLCAGSGTYYELRFAFCNHIVADGPDVECSENDCEHREYVAFVQREKEELEAVNQ
jgi:hypothetical protein